MGWGVQAGPLLTHSIGLQCLNVEVFREKAPVLSLSRLNFAYHRLSLMGLRAGSAPIQRRTAFGFDGAVEVGFRQLENNLFCHVYPSRSNSPYPLSI